MTDPAIEQIIAGMSEAEQAALCGRWMWNSIEHAEEGEARLFELGLWSAANLRKRKPIHTPLGLRVRAALRERGK